MHFWSFEFIHLTSRGTELLSGFPRDGVIKLNALYKMNISYSNIVISHLTRPQLCVHLSNKTPKRNQNAE